ncbi:MAG TPA: NAD(P)-binding domain-containing protein [Anaerolineales bacterium]|nr:NAD(P)-binding domain-containing protein [Anaerolineales bacterium]
MKITIIGPGNMGRAIATRAVAGGHSVTLVGKTLGSAQKAADEVRATAKQGAEISATTLENVEPGDVVVLALWYGTNIEVARQLSEKLKGKTVVDIANPVNSTYDGLATASDSSSAEDVAKAVGSKTKVVKAFNTTYASTLLSGQVAGQPLDVFIAGDDEEAKNKVAQFIKDAGLRPVDTGPLSRARQIEGLGLLHIVTQNDLGTNYASAVKILS